MTCEEIATAWNIHDWATLAEKVNVDKDAFMLWGATLPVTVLPEGCRMDLEGRVDIRFGK